MEADLKQLQKESDTLTGRVDDPAVQRPLRQTRTRKPFPESLPRDEKRLLPAASCCPECGGALSYLGEDAAEQLELMRSAFRVIRTVREKHACTQCDAIVQARAFTAHRAGYRRTGAAGPRARVQSMQSTPRCTASLNIRPPGCGAEPLTAVGLGGRALPATVTAGRGASGRCAD